MTLRITSGADVYGFAIPLGVNSTYIAVDESVLATENPNISNISFETRGDRNWLIAEGNGAKLIEADGSFDVVVPLKVIHEHNATFNFDTLAPGFLLNDSDTDVLEALLGDGNSAGVTERLQTAETEGKVQIVAPNYLSRLNVAYSTAATLAGEGGEPAKGVVARNPENMEPFELYATIPAPEGRALYGFSAGLSYPGGTLVLDKESTLEKNSGLALGFGAASGSTTQQLYVESDGSPLADVGESITLTLVFTPVASANPGTATVRFGNVQYSSVVFDANRLVLFTNPSVRAVEEGDGLTTLNFLHDVILDAELAEMVCLANSNDGQVALTTFVKLPNGDPLPFNTNVGRYALSTPEHLQAFAEAVNAGENEIRGQLMSANAVPSEDFVGIGTEEYPFQGELYCSYISAKVINRVAGSEEKVVGGFVDYLGEGGTVYEFNISGTVTAPNASVVGGLVGQSNGGTIYHGRSRSPLTIWAPNAVAAGGYVGEVLGASRVYTCDFSGSVTGGTNAGGIVGRWDGSAASTIYTCTSSGSISGAVAGGIVGSASGGTLATSHTVAGSTVTGSEAAGGVVGNISETAVVNNCANNAAVSGGILAGGIAASASGTISIVDSWSGPEAAVSASGENAAVGGILGEGTPASLSLIGNFNLSALSATGEGVALGGITGKLSAAPTLYQNNYYLSANAPGDGADALGLGEDSSLALSIPPTGAWRLSLTGANPGKYVYADASAARAEFGSGEGLVGANPQPIEITTTVTAPVDSDVYALTMGVHYAGAYLVLDEEATKKANPHLPSLDFFGTLRPASQEEGTSSSATVKQLYIETDHTVLIRADEALSFTLVFIPTLAGGEATRLIGGSVQADGNRLVLITDPYVRAATYDYVNPALEFNQGSVDLVLSQNKAQIAPVIGGQITLTKHPDINLTLDNEGYYLLGTSDEVEEFARAVNTLGENKIKGRFSEVSLPEDFEGIGTTTCPFCGELTGGPVTVNRSLSAIEGSYGGLINYLGKGGALKDISVTGSLSVVSAGGSLVVGGIVGRSDGGIFSHVTGDVDVVFSGSTAEVGGLLGIATTGTTLEASIFTGSLSASGSVGGITGRLTDVTVTNCAYAGTISGSGRLGGIAGVASGTTSIAQSWNGPDSSIGATSAGSVIGGIIGESLSKDVSISDNFALGTLTAQDTSSIIGGITGKLSATPSLYKNNYYLDATATGDGSDTMQLDFGLLRALRITADRLAFEGSDPGRYYLSGEPKADAQGTWLLYTADDLFWFANKVNTNTPAGFNKANAKLMADIDLVGETFPGISGYGGVFDGAGHTVVLGTALRPGVSLFASCEGATLKNITTAGTVISDRFNNRGGGALVIVITNGRVENCHNKAEVTNASGIAGTAIATDFIGCTNSGAITGTSTSMVGGIVAELTGPALIENCTNSGAITGGEYVGGIIGKVNAGSTADVTVRGCANSGKIVAMYSGVIWNDSRDDASASGIVAFVESLGSGTLTIDRCTNSGDVTGNVFYLGGIMGTARMYRAIGFVITNCTNTGNITGIGNGGYSVGGILAQTDRLAGPSEVLHDNTNHGNISSERGGSVSSIGPKEWNGDYSGNKSSVLVGNDANSGYIELIGAPGPGGDPDPGPGGDPDPGPNPVSPNPDPTPDPVPDPGATASPAVSAPALGPSDGTSPAPTDSSSEGQLVENRVADTTSSTPQSGQPVTEPDTPLSDPTKATEVSLTPIPLGLGFQTAANTVLTLAVGFIALGIFTLGGFVFWRTYRRRIGDA
ncbi:MAG: hypothetical protein LBC23_05625 [Coriobacteriales bacterium]|nr:hypothetical protein [Coriobacteriales bacterium]